MSRAAPGIRRSRWWVLIGPVLVVSLAIAGCSESGSSDTTEAGVPGLTHVHGLGINPSDGQLYVASHFGVFRIRDREAERMGNLIQDTMGFTVAGPDRFLGSGHPDIQNDTILEPDMRPLLGLIESNDRAATWRGLSLQGEVDFHALAFGHGQVYGFDATGGRLLVSTDLRTWESRSEEPLGSIAVSPDSADLLVATGQSVPLTTIDGGRTWSPVLGAPPLVVVSWDKDAGLWGVASDGSTYQSTDGGATWAKRGSVDGQPTALLTHPSGLYVATSSAVYQSTDRAATWTTLYEIPT